MKVSYLPKLSFNFINIFVFRREVHKSPPVTMSVFENFEMLNSNSFCHFCDGVLNLMLNKIKMFSEPYYYSVEHTFRRNMCSMHYFYIIISIITCFEFIFLPLYYHINYGFRKHKLSKEKQFIFVSTI